MKSTCPRSLSPSSIGTTAEQLMALYDSGARALKMIPPAADAQLPKTSTLAVISGPAWPTT